MSTNRRHPITENTVELNIGMQFLLSVKTIKASQSCRPTREILSSNTVELNIGMRYLLSVETTKASQSCRPMGDILLQKIL